MIETVSIWTKISAVGQMVAALGTLAAVWISLRMAMRSVRPILRVTVSHAWIPGPIREPWVMIDFANIGSTRAKVQSIYWVVGYRKAARFAQIAPANMLTTEMPAVLEPGENGRYTIAAADFQRNGAGVFWEIKSRRWWRFLPRVKIQVNTAAGYSSSAAVPRNFVKYMLSFAPETKPPSWRDSA